MTLVVTSGGKEPLRVRQIIPGVSDQSVQDAMRHNGLSELVVKTDSGQALIYAESLRFSGASQRMPKVGQQVSLSLPGRSQPITGTVAATDKELTKSEKVASGVAVGVVAGAVIGGAVAAIRFNPAPTGKLLTEIGSMIEEIARTCHGAGVGMTAGSAAGGVAGAVLGLVRPASDAALKHISVAP